MCTAVLIGLDPASPPPPRIWSHMQGCLLVSQDKIDDDISLRSPVLNTETKTDRRRDRPMPRDL
jgi:hypothetical protein